MTYILETSYFFLWISLSITNCQDYLTHINLIAYPRKEQDQKYWLLYVNKLPQLLTAKLSPYYSIMSSLKDLYSKSQSYLDILHPTKYYLLQGEGTYTEVIWAKRPIKDFKINGSTTERLPMVNIEVSTPEQFNNASVRFGSYNINFYLHPMLRLNITFLSIDFLVVGEKCENDMVWIQSKSKNITRDLIYCGFHSQFSVYPQGRKVRFIIKVYQAKQPIHVSASFSVISKNILESHSPLKIKEIASLSVDNLITHHLMVYSFRIEVAKYNGIRFNITSYSSMSILIFFGPDYSSQVLYSSMSNLLFISTFQCLVKCVLGRDQKNSFSEIMFTGKGLPRMHINVTNNKYHKYIKFQKNQPHNTTVFVFQTATQHLQLMILSFEYEGLLHPYCLYNGMIIYNLNNGELNLLESLCKKFAFSNTSSIFTNRTFYSKDSSFLVVLYHYTKYSGIKINFTVSLSNCEGVNIDFCEILFDFRNKLLEVNDIFSVTNNGIGQLYLKIFTKTCFVLQFHTNPHGRRKATTKNCKSIIQLDQTHPEDELWKFELLGYLEKKQRDISVEYPTFVLEGGDFNRSVSVWNIQNNTYIHGCTFDVKYSFKIQCQYTSANGILVKSIYFVKTPVHKNTVTPKIFVSRWTQSWTNIIINYAGKVSEVWRKTTRVERPMSLHFVFRIVKSLEHILLMNVKTQRSFDLKIQAEVDGWDGRALRKLNWKQQYRVGKLLGTNVVLALPGMLKSIYLFGIKNASAQVDYIWIHDKINPLYINLGYCIAKVYKNPTEYTSLSRIRQYHSKVETESKIYHFFKNMTLPCLITRSYYGLKTICPSEKYSWTDSKKLCHQIGAELPQFVSQREQDELLSILKVIELFYYFEGFFIGYRSRHNKRLHFWYWLELVHLNPI